MKNRSFLYPALGALFAATGAGGQAWGQSDAPRDCAGLLALTLADTSLSLAQELPAGHFSPPGGDEIADLPAFCRVVGVSAPAVNFEVWLPRDWNGKYNGVGNGGMAGSISYGAMANALRRGYATASTDTGHQAGPVPFDASWASGRPDLIEDFGHRALHLTTVNAKAIVEAFYGSAPAWSYFTGCSKGGQMGLMEAQRYPQDFDGIVAGNPANDWTRFYAGAHLWYSLAMLADTEAWIPPAKLPALGNAVNAACDALDGIEDGILQDPRTCEFQPAELLCPAGVDNDSCLTAPQVTAVEKIWSGARNSAGELIYPGLAPGGEAAPGGWETWVTGAEPGSSLHWRGGEGFFRWFVFDDPEWDFRSFDFDDDLEYALARVGDAVDANDPDLREFRDRGARLLVYHGWADPDISPLASIDYFERVVEVIGDDLRAPNYQTALDSTRNFFRLFLAPGMGHCRGGPGPDRFDALAALENWVEQGIAPDSLRASSVENGEVVRSRPLCAFPESARYSGRGSTDEANNFHCAAAPQRSTGDIEP